MDRSKMIVDTSPKPTITFSGNYIVCDTCQMTILVHHDECTTCGEITIDSGTVYLATKILEHIDTLAINSDQQDTFLLPPNYIPLHELFFLINTILPNFEQTQLNLKIFIKHLD